MTENNEQSSMTSEFGFTTPIPDELIEEIPKIGTDAFSLWSYLMFRIYNEKRKKGEFVCWPTYDTIHKDTAISKNRISKAIKVLLKTGWLKRRKRYSGSTIYILTSPQYSQNGNNGEKQNICSISPETGLQYSRNGTALVPKQESNQEQLTKTTQPMDDVHKLIELGISESKAKSLTKYYDAARIDKAKEVFIQGNSKGQNLGPGWLVNFIKEDWHVPNWFVEDSDSEESRRKYMIGLEGT